MKAVHYAAVIAILAVIAIVWRSHHAPDRKGGGDAPLRTGRPEERAQGNGAGVPPEQEGREITGEETYSRIRGECRRLVERQEALFEERLYSCFIEKPAGQGITREGARQRLQAFTGTTNEVVAQGRLFGLRTGGMPEEEARECGEMVDFLLALRYLEKKKAPPLDGDDIDLSDDVVDYPRPKDTEESVSVGRRLSELQSILGMMDTAARLPENSALMTPLCSLVEMRAGEIHVPFDTGEYQELKQMLYHVLQWEFFEQGWWPETRRDDWMAEGREALLKKVMAHKLVR
ncbi:MAG: hypothetical protein FWG50_07570 [Kiritimatiellaeota bacterium]|nr:hypothetical protein [Kiritimatiellota bacterium]